MNSIGDLVDRLVIENIKIFNLRQRLHDETLDDKTYVELNSKMMTLNDNKSVISSLLDDKVERVINGKERNCILKVVKTY